MSTNYFGRRVLRVKNLDSDLAKTVGDEISAKIALEKVSVNENEVCLYVPNQMKKAVIGRIVSVLNKLQTDRMYGPYDVEVKSTIVMVTNVPRNISEINMDMLMNGFGKTLSRFEFIKLNDIIHSKYGWIVFEDIESAESCIAKLHTTRIQSSCLYCCLMPENVTDIRTIIRNTITTQIHGFSEKNCNETMIREILQIVCKITHREVKFVRVKSVKTSDDSINNLALVDWQASTHAISCFKQFEHFSMSDNKEVNLDVCFCLPGVTAFDDLFKTLDEPSVTNNTLPAPKRNPNDKKKNTPNLSSPPFMHPQMSPPKPPILQLPPSILGMPPNQHILQHPPVHHPHHQFNRLAAPQSCHQVFIQAPMSANVLHHHVRPPFQSSPRRAHNKQHYVAKIPPSSSQNSNANAKGHDGNTKNEEKLKETPTERPGDQTSNNESFTSHGILNDPSIVQCGDVSMKSTPPNPKFASTWKHQKAKSTKRWSATRSKCPKTDEQTEECESKPDELEQGDENVKFGEISPNEQQTSTNHCSEIPKEDSPIRKTDDGQEKVISVKNREDMEIPIQDNQPKLKEGKTLLEQLEIHEGQSRLSIWLSNKRDTRECSPGWRARQNMCAKLF